MTNLWAIQAKVAVSTHQKRQTKFIVYHLSKLKFSILQSIKFNNLSCIKEENLLLHGGIIEEK
jgi:hypothetical protein